MSGVATFIIVSRKDNPIYEADLGTVKKEDSAHLHQFIVHAALDVVDEVVWSTSASYLKVVDKFNDLFVSAYVTAGHTKFMLLHGQKNEVRQEVASLVSSCADLSELHPITSTCRPAITAALGVCVSAGGDQELLSGRARAVLESPPEPFAERAHEADEPRFRLSRAQHGQAVLLVDRLEEIQAIWRPSCFVPCFSSWSPRPGAHGWASCLLNAL
eukprot:scaffold2319_cov406-Prasinococcus_capsulatus_cf.AAC.7